MEALTAAMLRPRPAGRVCVLLASLSLAACGGEPATDDRETGGTAIVAVGADARTLFPYTISFETDKAVTDLLFDRLAEVGDDLRIVGDGGFTPRLAERWEWSADSLSIAFHLNPAARFHDGRPVRATDVRFSFVVATDPATGSAVAPLLSNIDSVSVRDSLTAVAWYRTRRPEQFYELVYQLFVVPEHVYGSVPRDRLADARAVATPTGTGRFRFASHDPGARLELVADTANYRGRARLDRVIFTPTASPATAVSQLLAGEIDFFPSIPIDQVPRFDSAAVARTIPYALAGYAYMGMNAHHRREPARPHPVLGDAAVRRALSMAVDRRALLENVYRGAGRIGRGPFHGGSATGDTTIQLPRYDTVAAAAMLDSAGWRRPSPGAVRMKDGRPLRFGLMVPSVSYPRVRYSVLLQEQLASIGARVDVEQVDPGAYTERQARGDFDTWIATVVSDPGIGGARQVWGRGGIGGGQNYLRYASAEVDALIDSAAAARDEATMRGYSRRAYERIVADAPAIWLYDVLSIAGAHRRLRIPAIRSDGWWSHLADWSIPATERIDRDRIGLAPGGR